MVVIMTNTDNEVPEVTAATIAKWLFTQIQEVSPRPYYQDRAVRQIRETYGQEWSYRNQNGNWAIDKTILKEFGKLKETDPNVVWDSIYQAWRRLTDEQLERQLQLDAQAKQRREEVAARNEERNRNG